MDNRSKIVRPVWLLRIVVGLLPLLWVPVSQGQTTSITSSGLNTQVSHGAGQPNYDITGGTRPGNGPNLFHSFGNFSVGTNDVARFLNDSGLATTNILSRVTGGNPSNIFGEINTANFPGANLYLINPAGVLFGPTATLNVSGSVHVSTADYLRLADGLRFNAVPGPQDALLSQAPVVAFGFLNVHPRPITVQGSQLAVPEGKSLSLIGGNIHMTKGALTAPSGQINLVSLAGRGLARMAPEGITIAAGTPRGTIQVNGGDQPRDVTRLDASGDEGGAVVIRGGKIVLANMTITTEAHAPTHTGAGIVVEATKSVTVDQSVWRTRTSEFANSAGGAGPVSITAPLVTASDLDINTSSLFSNGNAGDVTINVRNLSASNLHISTIAFSNSGATNVASGNVSIRATRAVTLQNGSIDTSTGGAGGNISIRAATLTLDGGVLESAAEQEGGSRAGNIVIEVGRLTMRSFPQILTIVGGDNHGGDIRVRATDAVTIDSGSIRTVAFGTTKGGSITLSTPSLRLDHGGGIATIVGTPGPHPPETGRAGDISIHVRTLAMSNGARIVSNGCCDVLSSAGNINLRASRSISIVGASNDFTPIPTQISSIGNAGRVHIVTPSMQMDDRAVVSASDDPFAGGHAGRVVLDVGKLTVANGATISAASSGTGTPGVVSIHADKSITLNKGTITAAGASHGGTVNLHAGKSIGLRNGSLISADSTGEGDAGYIALHARKSFVSHDSTVSAKAGQGNGGTIEVGARNVRLTNSQLTTSAAGGPETVGGEITVHAKHLTLKNSQILSTATEGDGGTIHIRSRAFHKDAKSVIDASSESGTDGTVTIKLRP